MSLEIAGIKKEYEEQIQKAQNLDELLRIKGAYLGKSGIITQLSAKIREIPKEERKEFGQLLNQLKDAVTADLGTRMDSMEKKGSKSVNTDPGLPGLTLNPGTIHPITKIIREICNIFHKLGFQTEFGPEIETDFYNFEALNIPPHHPARDMQDTFFLDESHVLRTQTSGIQIRTMEKQKPPIRIIAPGKVFRCDHDVTHSPVFHQIEGLMVDENIHFGHLKYVLRLLIHELFGEERSVRFRPSFFPFTEPSAEMDVSCFLCNGKGCRLCSHTGWIEILGCGMVDPNVFKSVNLDSQKYTGWAFGIGVERIAMLRYGINDIRLFYENDQRFLKQFSSL